MELSWNSPTRNRSSQSLRCVLLVFLGLPSSDECTENFRIFRTTCVETNLVEKKCVWLAMSTFPLHVLRLMEGWHKVGFRSGDLRMEGDIRFIAASFFFEPCVEVKGSASMFGNIHFEGCHNKDQDRRPALGVETHPKIGGKFQNMIHLLRTSFYLRAFSGEPPSVQQTGNHLNSSLL